MQKVNCELKLIGTNSRIYLNIDIQFSINCIFFSTLCSCCAAFIKVRVRVRTFYENCMFHSCLEKLFCVHKSSVNLLQRFPKVWN